MPGNQRSPRHRRRQVSDDDAQTEDMLGEEYDDGEATDDAETAEQHADGGMEQDGLPEVPTSPFPPPGLKEISSLASWTVSTSKPGCGVAALRSPDPALFWQSDGPQPHLLSLHFFKLVAIVHMRVCLDFAADESYTPTRMQFCAGTGLHDLIEFAEMTFEEPRGWIDVDFSGVGPVERDGDDDEEEEGEVDWDGRPVLKAFLVQLRILENHQNGKDTHLRGLQIFARDKTTQEGAAVPDRARQSTAAAAAVAEPSVTPRKSKYTTSRERGVQKSWWMEDPDLR
ncbi:hypothetical protein LTR66_007162 [Elasticomyces elasticus]|nr:hypothetical protein LTR66_007162 [Elasticomyces elasticus]